MKTKSPSLSIALAISALIALFASPRANADPITAYSITVTPLTTAQNLIAGFEFTPISTFDISALGFWDQGHNGLTTSHQVAIYYGATGGGHTAGDLVVGTLTTVQTADSGGGSLDIGNGPAGWFAYHTLSSNVTLQAGVLYVIAANTDGVGGVGWEAPGYESVGAHTNNAPITTGTGRYAINTPSTNANVFYPALTDTVFYSTPNFLVAAAVPEPSSLALLSICGLAFVSWRVRRGMRRNS